LATLVFLERLADFSHLAVWVQVFPLALDHLLHPAHQTTALRPLDPVTGLEAENVAKNVVIYPLLACFFLVILTGKNLLAAMCECRPSFERFWIESRGPILIP
jgi:hypothetical protein